jgi:hypothetical protein
VTAGRVDWRRLTETEFNELAQQLLLREYNSKPGLYTRVIDGRGGDGGIDIDVRVKKTDQLVEIFQLKFFSEGFSSGFIARRTQIKKSFETAMTEEPPVWTLVVPCDGTIQERRSVTVLGTGKKVRVRFVGKSELNDLLTKYPDIADWATRDPARSALALVGREKAALTAPGDLAAEVVRLHDRADARSAFWGSTVSVAPDGTVTEQLFAKHPDAATREPLSITLKTQFTPDHEDLRKAFVDSLNYGAAEPVTLPSEVVQSFTKMGPAWFAEEGGPGVVSFHGQPLRPPDGPARINSKNAEGDVVATLSGRVTNWGAGGLGGSVDIRFEGGLRQRWRIPRDLTSSASVDFRLEPIGSSAVAIQRAIRLLDSLRTAATVDLTVDGMSTGALLSGGQSMMDIDLQFRELVDDMAALEKELDVTFEFPKDFPSADDRIWLRVVRNMLEGKVSIVPNAGGMTATLTGVIDDSVRGFVSSPNAVAIQHSDWRLEILGQVLTVGDVILFHQSVEVENPESVLARLEAGTGEGLSISLQPTDGTGFRIYSVSRLPVDRPIGVAPWGITGFGEHPSLSKLQELIESSGKS